MSRGYAYMALVLIIGFAFSDGRLRFVVPEYFPVPTYNFEDNPIALEKIELGRALFYDPILSLDNTISCASCHAPFNAFAHTDHDLSHGINDSIGTRNAPALFNLAWHSKFMWDGAVHHLDVQALAPINHPAEMGESLIHVVHKLQASSIYPTLFYTAYGDSTVTGETILKALAQFQLSLISANSKYDQVKQGMQQFTAQEQKGYELFLQNCNACHREPLFTNVGFANNGLTVDTTLRDYGRIHVTQIKSDSLQFKVPSLRNLSFTYPYMHDGRFHSLQEVLQHYNGAFGLNHADNLPASIPIDLDAHARVELISFLLTLNDQDFVFDKRHQFPNILRTKK